MRFARHHLPEEVQAIQIVPWPAADRRHPPPPAGRCRVEQAVHAACDGNCKQTIDISTALRVACSCADLPAVTPRTPARPALRTCTSQWPRRQEAAARAP